MFDHSVSVAVHVNTEKGLDFKAYIAEPINRDPYLVFIIGDVSFFINDMSVLEELNRALSSNLRLCLEHWAAIKQSSIRPPTPQTVSV